MEKIYIITFLIYYLIATFFLLNIVFNPRFELKMVNKKTKEVKEPSAFFIICFCFLWIIYIPLSINKGEK